MVLGVCGDTQEFPADCCTVGVCPGGCEDCLNTAVCKSSSEYSAFLEKVVRLLDMAPYLNIAPSRTMDDSIVLLRVGLWSE